MEKGENKLKEKVGEIWFIQSKLMYIFPPCIVLLHFTARLYLYNLVSGNYSVRNPPLGVYSQLKVYCCPSIYNRPSKVYYTD